jgi:hypothetical protein
VTDPDPTQDFIEHFGTKGMKWGVRNARNVSTRRAQTRVDRIARVADGTASKVDRYNAAGYSYVYTKKHAKTQLSALRKAQDKVNRGEISVVRLLMFNSMVRVKDLRIPDA